MGGWWWEDILCGWGEWARVGGGKVTFYTSRWRWVGEGGGEWRYIFGGWGWVGVNVGECGCLLILV